MLKRCFAVLATTLLIGTSHAAQYDLPTDAWYQLQLIEEPWLTLCSSGDSVPCDVDPGRYKLLRFTVNGDNSQTFVNVEPQLRTLPQVTIETTTCGMSWDWDSDSCSASCSTGQLISANCAVFDLMAPVQSMHLSYLEMDNDTAVCIVPQYVNSKAQVFRLDEEELAQYPDIDSTEIASILDFKIQLTCLQ